MMPILGPQVSATCTVFDMEHDCAFLSVDPVLVYDRTDGYIIGAGVDFIDHDEDREYRANITFKIPQDIELSVSVRAFLWAGLNDHLYLLMPFLTEENLYEILDSMLDLYGDDA